MPDIDKFYIEANPRGNDRQRRTDADLHSHKGPDRIKRMVFPAINGMLDSDVNAFPVYATIPDNHGGNLIPPGHTLIVKIIGPRPNGVFSNLSDDTMQVDAPSIGGPL